MHLYLNMLVGGVSFVNGCRCIIAERSLIYRSPAETPEKSRTLSSRSRYVTQIVMLERCVDTSLDVDDPVADLDLV